MSLLNNFRDYLLDQQFKITVFKDKVNIVNYQDILNFTSMEIKVKYSEGIILISGSNLTISKLLIDEVLISGVIEKIELR